MVTRIVVALMCFVFLTVQASAVCRSPQDDHLYRCGGTVREMPDRSLDLGHTPEEAEVIMGLLLKKFLSGRPYLQCHKYDWQCIEERDRRERENMREIWELILKNK